MDPSKVPHLLLFLMPCGCYRISNVYTSVISRYLIWKPVLGRPRKLLATASFSYDVLSASDYLPVSVTKNRHIQDGEDENLYGTL